MAVTVDECIGTGDVRDDIGSRPGLRLLVDTHVTDENDVIRAFCLCCVNSGLDCGVDAFTGCILAEAIDVSGVVFVHEVGRSGLGDRFGGGDTDKCDLLAVCFDDLISIEHRRVAFDLYEVRGNVRIFRLLDESKQLIHTVVEFMVAERCEIITDKVHDVDDRFALGEGADRSALYVVARVNKDDFVAFRFEGLLEVCKTCIAPTVADAAVHVVREQNDRVARRFYGSFFGFRKELEGVDRGVAAHAVHGEVAAVEFDVLRLAVVLCAVALDVVAAFNGLELEQRVCRVFFGALYELYIGSVCKQILTFGGFERIRVIAFVCLDAQFGHFCIARDVRDFDGQNDCGIRNVENTVGQRCVCRNELMLFVVVEVILTRHDLAACGVEDDNFVTVSKRLDKLHLRSVRLGIRLGGRRGFGISGRRGIRLSGRRGIRFFRFYLLIEGRKIIVRSGGAGLVVPEERLIVRIVQLEFAG